MYALNIEKDTGRVLSACIVLENGTYTDMPIVDNLPKGDITDYLYINDEYVYLPRPIETVALKPTQLDIIEAQVVYTAMMTDTLLEV